MPILIAATVGLFSITPTGFIPAQDQGYFLTVIQLPAGSSLERTDAVMRKVAARILPIPGVKGAVMLAGFDGASQTQAPNAAAAYIPLKSFAERKKLGVTFPQIMAEAQKRTADITEARLLIVPPPLIQGIGSAGGYRMIVEDHGGHSVQQLSGLSWGLIAKANQTPGLKQVYTLFDISTPRVFADIDRAEGGDARRAAVARVRGAAGLSRLGLHQRLQPARADLSRDRAGRCAVPRDRSRHRQPSHPVRFGRDGAARLGDDLPGPDGTVPGVALQSASRRSRSTATPRRVSPRASR